MLFYSRNHYELLIISIFYAILYISISPNFSSNRVMYTLHCVKSVQIRSFFWSVFSCIYEVNLCVQFKYWKILSYLDTFHAVLNIASAIKKMTVNELKHLKTIVNKLDLLKKTFIFIETSKKKKIIILKSFLTKVTKIFPDPNNTE